MTGEKPSHPTHDGTTGPAGRVEIATPAVADGPDLYRIARDSGALDVNSPYVYLLWCRDFAQTSVVARVGGVAVGFVTGYIRPDAPETFVVWQVAVDTSQRGGGVAGTLLAHVLDRMLARGVRYLETTITPDNTASIKLFSALARKREVELTVEELFPAELFPDAHEGEDLYRIGPFDETTAPTL